MWERVRSMCWWGCHSRSGVLVKGLAVASSHGPWLGWGGPPSCLYRGGVGPQCPQHPELSYCLQSRCADTCSPHPSTNLSLSSRGRVAVAVRQTSLGAR